ncbi:MAG: amidohydrolase family protein [Thermodesulfobacteriota bacterium]|nr:amidohydrolase family protein [Thermodesulfobacteriota bacterium]
MMTLYRSRYLVPVSSPALEQGAIVVENGRIIAVGAASTLETRYPQCQHHDYGDAILLPAFVNAHTHLELSHYFQWNTAWAEKTGKDVDLGAGAGFVDWILRLIQVKIDRGTDIEQYRQAWHTGLQQAFATGTGQLGDILATTDLAAEAAHHLLGRCFIEVIGQDPIRANRQLQQVEDSIDLWPDAHFGAAPHSFYSLSYELLKLCYRQCNTYSGGQPIRTSIHIAESPDEVEFLATSSGPIADQLYPFVGLQQHVPAPRNIRSLQLLEQVGGLHADTLLVHGVHLNQQEITQVAAAGCSMVLCPRSNAQLNVGVAPAAQYLRAGVPLALGTDSLASNDSLSLWDEMEFALGWFNGDLSPQQLLHMCTLGGARALHGDCGNNGVSSGQLAVGAPATFQVVQPGSLPSLNQIYPFLCRSGRSNEVQHVVVDGVSRFIAGG